MTGSYRILHLVIALILVVACSDRSPEATAQEEVVASNIVAGEPPVEHSLQDDDSTLTAGIPNSGTAVFNKTWTGDLDVMEERRVIRVLTVYGVGRYYLDGPQEKGITYEMLKRFEDHVNEQLGRGHMRVHVVFLPVTRDQLLPALQAGLGDIVVAGLSITPERKELIDFSRPSSKPVSEILVTGPSAAKLTSIDDLAGQTIYLRHSSSYRESVEELNQRFTREGKPLVVIEHISEMLEDDDLIEMVNAGLLPWAIVDAYKTQLWDGVFNDLVVRDDIVFRTGARIAWAFRKNSPLLEAAANEFLKANRQGTLFGNILVNRYIRDFDWAANALAGEGYKRFERLIDIFKIYGEKYGVDYLMVAAQGYQESRLDQRVRSHAGAVGIMQLLPTTAADPKVGIPDIESEEPNIHAGVKYLQYLRNRYFNDPDIAPVDRTLLAFAAYNAGPARMINLRAKAKKMGYDPNRWFDNVEVAAAKEIGRETVQYVANIYKYYIAYRLAAEQQIRRQTAREA
ncbi:MAG: lytic transglycosylase F, partial [Halieaceae bacterium]|nr:lytic transglycosylase F [Halieaceae bacterium]